MKRRPFIVMGIAWLTAMPKAARAQVSGSPPRIGFLNNLNPDLASANTDAFQRGLRDLGWIEGRDIIVDYRWADGDMARHAALVSELVNLPVALIVTAGSPSVRAAQQATQTIPIVVAIMPDPVALGFVASFARPGGNITGLANLFEELTPKQLQILKEVLPNARRIAMLSDPAMGDRGIQSATEAAARTLGIVAHVFNVGEPSDLEVAMRTAKQERVDGILVLPSPFFNHYRRRIAEFANMQRLPTFSEAREYVQDGGLLSYGPSFPQMYYRAATYVDRILKGGKPGDLPIERPTKFELVVNLKTARSLGITISPAVLSRADEVIR